jgi:DNA-binding protein Fis
MSLNKNIKNDAFIEAIIEMLETHFSNTPLYCKLPNFYNDLFNSTLAATLIFTHRHHRWERFNKVKAAKYTGLNRNTIQKLIRDMDLEPYLTPYSERPFKRRAPRD